jgi:hypothetical protein
VYFIIPAVLLNLKFDCQYADMLARAEPESSCVTIAATAINIFERSFLIFIIGGEKLFLN